MHYHMFTNSLTTLPFSTGGKSRAINAENPTGERGKGGTTASHLGRSRKGAPCLRDLAPGSVTTLADINGTGIIQHIWITVPDKTSEADCYVLSDLVIRMYWDEEVYPSVECPLGDFFCNGFAADCEINSAPIVVVPSRGMNCYFPMPFQRRARITIENQHQNPLPCFFYQIDYCLYDVLPDETAYFHAQWNRQRITEKAVDYVILDNVTGKGRYVGTYIALTTLERYWWGEGEIKFYLDGDVEYPTICGTGMEDYFGGSWSFARPVNGRTTECNYSTLWMGYPYYSKEDTKIFNQYHNTDTLPQRGFYRWHIPDPIFFEEDIKVTLQQIGVSHGGLFERQDDVASVAYWYQTEPHHPYLPLPPKEYRWPR